MKYSYLCEKCKRKDDCKGYVEKTTDFVQLFFCPKFIHNDGKPISNADKIRSMSDEELAQFICTDEICVYDHGEDEMQDVLNYLKSEAK